MNGTRYTAELINDYVEQGFWHPTLLTADLCDRCAREFSNKEAVVDIKTRLTWGEVNRQIDKIARGLRDLGFEKDDVLATQLPNSVEYFLLLFATEKAGTPIVGSQPTFRHAEMESILRETRAKGIVITRKFRDIDYVGMIEEIRPSLPDLKHIIIAGDDVPEGTVSLKELMARDLEDKYPPSYFQKFRFKPWEVTRIFNTSGTTGIPKCFEWPPAPRLYAGRIMIERLDLRQDDIILAGWNITSGGVSLLARVCIPMVGAKLVNLEHFTPQATCEMIQKEKVTILALVPAEIAMLIGYPDLDRYDLSSVRVIFTGTQLLTYELGARAEERLGCRVVKIYGSGDTSAVCTTSVNDTQEVRLATVGFPVPGNEVQIIDDKGNPLPQGETGEVRAKGPSLISGYYGHPEITAESWKDGWIATGDAGKIDEAGHVVLVGRKRDVIIRGGQNIYPSEIENLLMRHPGVKDVSIVRMPDPIMGEKQCAYVVPTEGQTFDFEEMTMFLKSKRIAPYKLPERLEILAELPMVPAANKVDKDSLEADIAQKLEAENDPQR
ncbi:AMP-binding protein [Chloroflexota bacterium]